MSVLLSQTKIAEFPYLSSLLREQGSAVGERAANWRLSTRSVVNLARLT